MGISEKIKELEEEIKKTKYNKATQHHIGLLKARIAQLKRKLLHLTKTGSGKRKGGFDIKKSGDATVALIGLPSVGKSTILTKLTGAKSEVAHYAFTTLKCIPGMLKYKQANIQILDLPGIIEGAKDGKGRGREIISVARNADLILIVLDINKPEKQYDVILKELYGFGIRINSRPPNISIRKTLKGGINIITPKKIDVNKREITGILNAYGIHNAEIIIRERVSAEEVIDVLEGNRVYIPAMVVINKIDLLSEPPKVSFEYLPISADKGENIEKLKEEIYKKIGFIRIYTKKKGEKPDMDEPLVLRKGSSIEDVCNALHRDLKKNFRYALVWGKSVKHSPQRVGLEHILADEDIVEIIAR